jgi:hypothetical protein
MPYGRLWVLSTLAAVLVAPVPAGAQSVVSTHSGVIYFFEGAVYLGDQRLEPHLGKFQSVPQGADLRTADGRAEVLLTPGVFLRMGDRSTIRMVATQLADTQVELQSGSAIVDAGEPNANTSVTVIYKDWRVHFLQKGVYRIDSDPPRLSVRQGEAEVFVGDNGGPSVSVDRGMNLPLASVLVPEKSGVQNNDALSDWAGGRNDSIYADNAITSQIGQDPAAQTIGPDAFTYFPVLGLPSPSLGLTAPYGAFISSQPGFNSIYLPGYTYRPLMLGLVGTGIRPYTPSSPLRIGAPGVGAYTPIPRPPLGRPVVGHTVPRIAVPAHR